MPNSENKELEKKLKEVTARIKENTKLGQERAKKRTGSRQRNIGSESSRDFTEFTMYDELDKFETVSNQLINKRTTDFTMTRSIETMKDVAAQLEDPDLNRDQRDELLGQLEAAKGELDLSVKRNKEFTEKNKSGEYTDTSDDAKEYRATVSKIKDQIDNLSDIASKGNDIGVIKEFVKQQRSDLLAAAGFALTKNPMIAIGAKLFMDYRKIKKEKANKQARREQETLRQQNKLDEQEKTKILEQLKGADESKVDTSKVDDAVMPDEDLQAEIDVEFKESFTKAFIAEMQDMSDNEIAILKSMLESDEHRAALMQQLLGESGLDAENEEKMVEVLQEISDQQSEANAIAENSAWKAEENRIEAMRANDDEDGEGLRTKYRTGGPTLIGGALSLLKDLAGAVGSFITGALTFFAAWKYLFSKDKEGNRKAVSKVKKGMTGFKAGLVTLGRNLLLWGRILGGLALGASLLWAGWKTFNKWQETEGQELPERLKATAQTFGDTLLGLIGTSGQEISDAITNAFIALGEWWDNLDLVAIAKEALGFGETKEEKQARQTQDRKNDDAIETFKYLNREGADTEGIVTRDFFTRKFEIDEDQISKVPFAQLRSLLQSDNVSSDDREIIEEYLKKNNEPLVIEPRKPQLTKQGDIQSEFESPELTKQVDIQPEFEKNIANKEMPVAALEEAETLGIFQERQNQQMESAAAGVGGNSTSTARINNTTRNTVVNISSGVSRLRSTYG